MTIIQLPPVLHAMLPCCALENSRYAISGIHIVDRGNVRVIAATNGRLLGLVKCHLDDEDARLKRGITIDAKCVRSLGKPSAKKLDRYSLLKDNGRMELTLDNKKRVDVEEVEGPFPPFDDVIPEHRAGDKAGAPFIGVQPRVICDAIMFMRDALAKGVTEQATAMFSSRAPSKPFILQGAAFYEVFGLCLLHATMMPSGCDWIDSGKVHTTPWEQFHEVTGA